MKVKVLHTIATCISKGYISSFHNEKFKIEHVESPNGYLIDGTTFIPYHNVRELMIELEPLIVTTLSKEEVAEALALPEDVIKKSKKIK